MASLFSEVTFPCGYKSKSEVRSWSPFTDLRIQTPDECPVHGRNCNHIYGMARVMLCEDCLMDGIDSKVPLELGHPEVIYDGVMMHFKSKSGGKGALCGAKNEYMLSLSLKERGDICEEIGRAEYLLKKRKGAKDGD